MKNVIFSGNAVATRIKAVAAVLLFTSVLTASSVQAAEGTPKDAPVEIKYLGSTAGQPLFQINFNNPQSEEVVLTLRDEAGNLIFSDVVRTASYSKNLRFSDLDESKVKMKLTLRTKKDVQTKTFEISKSTRVVEDVAVVTL